MEDFEAAVRAQVRAMVSAGEAMTITQNAIIKLGQRPVQGYADSCRRDEPAKKVIDGIKHLQRIAGGNSGSAESQWYCQPHQRLHNLMRS